MDGVMALLVILSSLCSILVATTAVDTIATAQFIRDGNTTVSAGGSFELGFFSPKNSNKRYLGIWYKRIPEFSVVWVANREAPLLDSSGVLNVTQQGVLVLVNSSNSIIWSSNSTRSANNPVAKLLDSGNLVVKDANDDNPENFLWQSFDYPGDTLLPGMKFGWDTTTGLNRYLSSWKSRDDPALGDFTYRMDPGGYPQYFMRKDSVELFRSGPWNGLQFSGMPNVYSNPIYNFTFVFNQKEIYFIYELLNSSVISRMLFTESGILQRRTWMEASNSWAVHLTTEMTNCDTYGFCGAYGRCTVGNSPECQCLEGFTPKSPEQWAKTDWSSGCFRRTPLDCNNGDGFRKYSGVKVPDTRNSTFNFSMTLKECEMMCLKDCSCSAYANSDISAGGSGCLLWFGDLVDIRGFSENSQDLFIRMAASELGQSGHNWKKAVIIIVVVSAGTLILGLSITLCMWKKLRLNRKGGIRPRPGQGCYKETKNEDLELPLFDLATIITATDNFAINNKLGEGGFGPVYKGMMEGGQEIAVKLLSKDSTQGVNEFKNEVICIAKLQHRNLVKLIGYCIHGEERMLIYEYMPNNTLDSFIFDKSQRILLDWPKRFQIINGIARGLLYLHQDSRLRIIHRDLKGSNILLDYEMNPKISDFGLARIFGGNETEASTKRVVGTYGYMSPEYAIDGLFSVKSDVFSFGVLVLEILSGQRNRGFCHPDHHLNLLGHAWRLYKEGRTTELLDTPIADSCNLYEVLRSIHVGLLCVQKRPEDRPNMSSVVLMLGGEGALAQPKEPGYFAERDLLETDSSGTDPKSCSANMVSITELKAR